MEAVFSTNNLVVTHHPKKLCTPVQPAKVGAKSSSYNMLRGKAPDVHEVDQLTEAVTTGLHLRLWYVCFESEVKRIALSRN